VTALERVVGTSRSLIELAAALGQACLADERLVIESMKDPAVENAVEELADHVRAHGPEIWQLSPPTGFAELLDTDEIHRILHWLQSLDPISHLGVLRGLCGGALRLFFDGFRGPLKLEKGTPLPDATRPVNELFGTRCTPLPQKTRAKALLGHTGFDLYRAPDPAIRVTIDFSHSERLDALTWLGDRLPVIGTVHPRLDGDRLSYTIKGDRVFDVQPRNWSLQETLDDLKALGDAKIALLPELCLPHAGALEDALKSDPSLYPPLVVASSAHERINDNGEASSINESRVYLDGQWVLRHRKIVPLETRHIGNHPRFDPPLREDLAPPQEEIRLLSGEKTRLAVVICADLNSRSVPRVLMDCGVNLLLVPSLTYKPGTFNGAICSLASYCQAVCVVANPILDQLKGQSHAPFLLLAAVPRSGANQQSHEYFHRQTQTAARALLDPNRPLASALRWQ